MLYKSEQFLKRKRFIKLTYADCARRRRFRSFLSDFDISESSDENRNNLNL
jgi:hypothetical protein